MFNLSDIFSKDTFDEFMPLMLFGNSSMMDLLVLSMIFSEDELFDITDTPDRDVHQKTLTVSNGVMDLYVPFDQVVIIGGRIMGGHSGDLWWEEEYTAVAKLHDVTTGAQVWATSQKGQTWKSFNQQVQLAEGHYQVSMSLPEDSRCTVNFTLYL